MIHLTVLHEMISRLRGVTDHLRQHPSTDRMMMTMARAGASWTLDGSLFYFVAMLMLAISTTGATQTECSNALGMESGAIKNSQITSERWLYSDTDRNRHFRPHYARLNFAQRGGAWCSDDIDKYPNQYVEVDLLVNTKLTGLAIQGKATGGEFVDSFHLSYQRANESRYRKRENGSKWKLFSANNDTVSTVRIAFASPIIAQKIRIYPQSAEYSVLCMRLEIYGCQWTKQRVGLISYSIEGVDASSSDNSYDGTRDTQRGRLTGGLGRLTDDDIASADNPASKWVKLTSPTPVLSFQFSHAITFTQITVHFWHKDTSKKAFSSATIFASTDGVKYNVVKFFELDPDLVSSLGVFTVAIPVDNASARFLRCQFSQSSTAMLMSEIDFSSGSLKSTAAAATTIKETQPTTASTEKTVPVTKTQPIEPVSIVTKEQSRTVPPVVTKPLTTLNSRNGNQGGMIPGPTKSDNNRGLSFPIILTIVLGAVVVMAIVGIFIVRHCRKRSRNQGKTAHYKTKTSAPAASELLYEEKISLQGSSLVRYYPTPAHNGRQPYRTT